MYNLWQDLSGGTKTFDLVTLTLTFDLLLKNLTLAITSEPREVGLSYWAWIFRMERPFCLNKIFDPMTLTFNFDLLMKKLDEPLH